MDQVNQISSNDVISLVTRTLDRFVEHASPSGLYAELLEGLVKLTGSEFGFIGEVLLDENGQPYLKTSALTNIAWSPETQALYDENSQ